VLGANSNSDHPSPYPTYHPAAIDYPLNPRQFLLVGTGQHSLHELFLNDDLKRLSDARCKRPAALNGSEVIAVHAAEIEEYRSDNGGTGSVCFSLGSRNTARKE
jgi:hypothetical protein